MYTLDASIHLSALNPAEADSATSQAFLRLIRQRRIPLFCPTLLIVEVAAAVTRVFGDADSAETLAAAVRGLPTQTLVPLDETLAELAAHLAATARLRGADAVYAAVAQQYGTTLVTLDRQQLDRLTLLVPTVRPTEVLGQ